MKGKIGRSNILLEEKGKDLEVRKTVYGAPTSASDGGPR